MKNTVIAIAALATLIFSFILLLSDKEGWGWFLIVSVLALGSVEEKD